MCDPWGPFPDESKVNDSFYKKANPMDQLLY